MRRYISPILVDSVLNKALTDRGLAHADYLTDADIEAMVEDCMVGLRLFVEKDRLPQLMIDLTDILTESADAPPSDAKRSRSFSGTYRSR